MSVDRQSQISELEIRLQRSGLKWWEECESVYELHRLYIAEHGSSGQGKRRTHGGWRQEDTADKLKVHRTTVVQYIKMAEAFKKYPQLREESNFKAALATLKNLERPVPITSAHLRARQAATRSSTENSTSSTRTAWNAALAT